MNNLRQKTVSTPRHAHSECNIPAPQGADLYTQISKHLVNKTLLIVEDCNKQDEKGRKRKVKGGKYERRLKKCQGTHKKEEKFFPLF